MIASQAILSIGSWGGMDESKDRIRTEGKPHALRQTFTGFPTQGEADEREDITQSDGATGIGSHDLGEPLSEDLAGAG